MKKCSACKELKPIEEFYKDKWKRDLLMSRCKECEKRLQRERYKRNKGVPGYDPKIQELAVLWYKETKRMNSG